jgi:hypothetical protein
MYYAHWFPPINDGNPSTRMKRMIEVEMFADRFGIKFSMEGTVKTYDVPGTFGTTMIPELVFESEYDLNFFLTIFSDFRRGRA